MMPPLPKGKARLSVGASLLARPDEGHIPGLADHFHPGPPSERSDSADKLLIHGMRSSPIVFRHASRKPIGAASPIEVLPRVKG